jgi:hypothetical protein
MTVLPDIEEKEPARTRFVLSMVTPVLQIRVPVTSQYTGTSVNAAIVAVETLPPPPISTPFRRNELASMVFAVMFCTMIREILSSILLLNRIEVESELMVKLENEFRDVIKAALNMTLALMFGADMRLLTTNHCRDGSQPQPVLQFNSVPVVSLKKAGALKPGPSIDGLLLSGSRFGA